MNRDTRLSDVLHVLLHLGQVEEPVTSEVLARSMGTNPAVFRRTMAGLRKAGHVQSDKGHGGGWQLARPLRQISLLAVYEALGRPISSPLEIAAITLIAWSKGTSTPLWRTRWRERKDCSWSNSER